MANLALLDDRAVIALSGPEARGFLQGLITNDIGLLAPGKALYAALLTPQGKILFDFLIAEGDGALLIDCARASRDALVKRLSMYKLRAQVVIEARDQLEVLASWDGATLTHAVVYPDPRLDALGKRAIGARAEMPVAVSSKSPAVKWAIASSRAAARAGSRPNVKPKANSKMTRQARP